MGKQLKSHRQFMLKWCSIVLGNAILAFSVAAFVVPHSIIMGGVTGIGILLNHMLGIDIALGVLILNMMALLLGYLVLGKQFFVALRPGSGNQHFGILNILCCDFTPFEVAYLCVGFEYAL